MAVQRPDAYLCKQCGHRFNNEEKKTERVQINGIFTLRVVCPKCGSSDLRTTITGKD